MKHKFWNSRTYWNFFLSYILLIATLIAIMVCVSWFDLTRNYAADARRKNEGTASAIGSSINNVLEQLMVSAQRMEKTRWVHKLYSNSDIYHDYFHANRRAEITNELALYQAHPFVQKTALFFPEMDVSVSTQGWIPIRRYMNRLGVTNTESQRLILEEMRDNSTFQEASKFQDYLPANILLLTTPLERIKESRAYICFFINKQLLLDSLQKQMPAHLSGLRIWNNKSGEDILNLLQFSTDESGSIQELAYSSLIPSWSYGFLFDNSKLEIPLNDIVSHMMLYPLLFLMGIMFSGILAFATYRPFGKLLRRVMQWTISGDTAKKLSFDNNVIHIIENSFETLHQENLQMRKNAEQNIQRLRPETIKQLLRGHFDKEAVERDMKKYRIPFTDENYYQALLLFIDSGNNIPIDPCTVIDLFACIEKNMLSLENCHCEIIENIDNDILIVAAFSNEKAAAQVDVSFIQHLVRQCEPYLTYRPLISAGMPHIGFVGISISYHWAMEQRAQMSNSLDYAFYIDSLEQERYYYPFEWEIQLISSLKAGNIKSIQSIFNELYRKNIERTADECHPLPDKEKLKLISSIMETLFRVTSELNLNDRFFMDNMNFILSQESFTNKWDYIQKTSLEICQYVEVSQEPSTPGIGQDIINYVDEHFCNSDLSLKALSDQFDVSIQTISKIFKAAIGDTFYNYLYKKRMEYACTLLTESNSTMLIIANQIGYENEYSFKRAFIRFTGIRPKDYMQNHQLNR